jgi:hypothetical protein
MNTKVVFAVVLGPLLFTSALLAQTKDPVIGAYFNVEQALINEDLNAAKTAASDLAQKAQAANNGPILEDAIRLPNTATRYSCAVLALGRTKLSVSVHPSFQLPLSTGLQIW